MGSLHTELIGANNHALTANPNSTGAPYADIAARDADVAFSTNVENVNKLVRVDSPLSYWVLTSITPTWMEFSSTGADEWTELLDTPSTISPNLILQGNAGGTALEFGQDLRTTANPTFNNLTITGTIPNLIIDGVLNMTNGLITDVLDPVSAQDAATKNYIDSHITTVTTIQNQGNILDDFNTLGIVPGDGQFIVGTASAGVFVYESGSVVRQSLGLGSADGVSFNNVTGTRLGDGSNSAIRTVSTHPSIEIRETDAVLNEKSWSIKAQLGKLQFRASLDDNSSAVDWLTISRSGTTIDDIIFPAGKVGIGSGISVPDELLHIAKSVNGGFTALLLENSQANATSSINETVAILFGFGGDNAVGGIVIGKEDDFTDSAKSDSFMAFYTDRSNSFTEFMRGTSAGELAIGTTVVRAHLHNLGNTLLGVRNTTDETSQSISTNITHIVSPTNIGPTSGTVETVLRLFRDGTASTKFNTSADFQIGSYATTGIDSKAQLTLRLNEGALHIPDTDIMTWRANGNVGIGTLTPNRKLVVEVSEPSTILGFNNLQGMGINQSDTTVDNWSTLEFLAGGAIATIVATQYKGSGQGDLVFAARGTSGFAERMRITGNGNVGIGIIVPVAKLHVDQSSTTGAIPVLYLDQADVSEEMIKFNTTIGEGNAIEAIGSKTLSTTHFIKVVIPGTLTRYIPCGTIA